jgi:hypothetical protein
MRESYNPVSAGRYNALDEMNEFLETCNALTVENP